MHGAFFFDNGIIKFIHNVKSFTDKFFCTVKYSRQKNLHATTIKTQKLGRPCLNRKLIPCFNNLEHKQSIVN